PVPRTGRGDLLQLQGALPESLRADAAALELEQKAEPGAEQVVEVVDRQRSEGVGVEGRGRTAAQPGDELLLKQLLPGLVEDAHFAWRTDHVGELVEKPSADAVKSSDPGAVELLHRQVRTARPERRRDPQPQLFRRSVAKGQGEDLVRRDALLDEPAEALRRGESLPGARTGRNQESSLRAGVCGGRLLGAE